MHGSAMPVCPIILIQRRNILFRPHKAGNDPTAHLAIPSMSSKLVCLAFVKHCLCFGKCLELHLRIPGVVFGRTSPLNVPSILCLRIPAFFIGIPEVEYNRHSCWTEKQEHPSAAVLLIEGRFHCGFFWWYWW